MSTRSSARRHAGDWGAFAMAIGVMAAVAALTVSMFLRGRAVLEQDTRARILTLAAVAAQHLDPEDIAAVRGEADAGSPAYLRLARTLAYVRSQDPNIKFAYLLRPGEGTLFTFVADADALNPAVAIDSNNDGLYDGVDEPSMPGTGYDASVSPSIIEGQFRPTVSEPETDQWGTFITATAPVRDASGTTVAVAGFDVEISQYRALTTRLFSPVALILALLGAALIAIAGMYMAARRRLEAARRLEEERAGFLKLTYHQLGQPIAILRWAHDALREHADAHAKNKTILQHLTSEEDALERFGLIFQSLEHADKVQEGQLGYTAEVAPLDAIAAEAANRLRRHMQKRGQTLTVDLAADLPVRADATLLAGVVQELLQNASDFSKDGAEIALRVVGEGKNAVLTVQDRGCGIPEADTAALFERFARASNAQKAKPDGTGLGLYIAKGIVEKAGGTISLESEEGKGTTVRIALPVTHAAGGARPFRMPFSGTRP